MKRVLNGEGTRAIDDFVWARCKPWVNSDQAIQRAQELGPGEELTFSGGQMMNGRSVAIPLPEHYFQRPASGPVAELTRIPAGPWSDPNEENDS